MKATPSEHRKADWLDFRLRNVCNHPSLIKGIENLEDVEDLIEGSAKMVLVDKLLPKLKKIAIACWSSHR